MSFCFPSFSAAVAQPTWIARWVGAFSGLFIPIPENAFAIRAADAVVIYAALLGVIEQDRIGMGAGVLCDCVTSERRRRR
jgi:hypothetical protein